MEGYTYKKYLNNINNPYETEEQTLSSLKDDEVSVNSSLSSIDRDKANSELEKNEYVLFKDGHINKVLGKPHYKNSENGGTPAHLSDGDFVYSQYKKLSIPEKMKELFNFKKGGFKNTPADILKREIDVPHHNKMVALLKEPSTDKLSINSAKLMMEKNLKKLKNIAFAQEALKGFPQGTSPFLTNQGAEEEFKYDSQFLPKYQTGGRKVDKNKFEESVTKDGYVRRKDSPNYADRTINKRTNESSNNKSFNDLYAKYKKMSDKEIEEEVKAGRYRVDANGRGSYLNTSGVGSKWVFSERPYKETIYYEDPTTKTEDKTGTNPKSSVGQVVGTIAGRTTGFTPAQTVSTTRTNVQQNGDNSSKYKSLPTLDYEYDTGLSYPQKLGIAGNIMGALDVTKFNPKRSQYSYTPVELERLNPQSYRHNIRSQFSNMVKANQAYNPLLSRVNNAQHFGTVLDKTNEMEANVYNQNVGIANQEATINAQGVNDFHKANIEAGQKYYDQTVLANQNFLREQQIARNQVVGDFLKYTGDNQKLAALQASLPMGSKTVYINPKTGERSSYFIEGWQPHTMSVPLYTYDKNKNVVRFNNAGMSIDSIPSSKTSLTWDKFKNQYNVPKEYEAYAYQQWLKSQTPS